ncbi:LAFE_0G12552g1_1 [Lachancea fermentati]|uniref:LAFE_0G12552g1_1 n=1 Tax=Lachancea fermentati TaxID=4955 RepID=A0A1G4MIF6_LACFM|nr:LAFE_0G12552g1_1 [Lachancea fermentati]
MNSSLQADEKVLVTGASGFIALHILDVLLSERFHVIGTVRSKDKGEKIKKSFEELYPYAQLDFEIVPDVAAAHAFDGILKKYPDIKHILHTASPFSFGSGKSMEETYLIPATHGTRNILESTKNLGKNVKHVVITSSFASILNLDREGDSSFIHTEKTWNPITWDIAKANEITSYIASKKLAEELSWKFLEENKSDVNFTITTVTPPYVLGPQMFDWGLERSSLNTSAEIVNQALQSTPASKGPFDVPNGVACDVRDVALLHMLPLRNENLAGHRLFPISGTGLKQRDYEDAKFNLQRVLDVMNTKFPELRGKISPGDIKDNKPYLDKIYYYNNDETCQLTGVEFKPFDVTIYDSTKQILDYEKLQSKS